MRMRIDFTVHKLNGGSVTVFCYGTIRDWRIKNLCVDDDTVKLLASTARQWGVHSLFIPWHSRFNARVAKSGTFPADFDCGATKIFWGRHVDGVVLGHKEAAFHTSGDCTIIVAYETRTNNVISAHAGRDCLIDRERISTRKPGRKHESVVYAIMEQFTSMGISPQDIHVLSVCGIAAEHFPHHWNRGGENRALVEDISRRWGKRCIRGPNNEGRIDLHMLIRAQFLAHGVPHTQIASDGVDTFSDVSIARRNTPIWWSHRRGDAERNGILVINSRS